MDTIGIYILVPPTRNDETAFEKRCKRQVISLGQRNGPYSTKPCTRNFKIRDHHIPMLVTHGAFPTIQSSENERPLHLAVKLRNIPAARALLTAGADVNFEVTKNQRPLYLAIENSDVEMVSFLAQHEADVHLASGDSVCALLHAVKRENIDVIRALLSSSTTSADIGKKDASGQTVLHILARAIDKQVVDLFDLHVNYGAEMSAEDQEGSTPLHEAVKAGNAALVGKFLDLGAIRDAQNHDGKKPLELATSKGHEAVVEVLGAMLKRTSYRRSVRHK